MTATTSHNNSAHSHRFATEPRPPTMAQRRDERLKCFSSFDDITESEEEDVQEPTSSSSSTTSERSPYANYDNEKALKMRSFSLTNNLFLSPRSIRHYLPSNPRLSRGFSDPIVRRKSSLPTILDCNTPEQSDDFLSLPPIPEAVSPVSPATTMTTTSSSSASSRSSPTSASNVKSMAS